MFDPWWAVAVMIALVVALATIAWRRRRNAGWLRRARREFHLRREWLEADVVTMAMAHGTPAGLLWQECEFEDEAAMAIDRSSGQLRAFVAITIGVDAGTGGGKSPREPVERRSATAVFLYDGRRWITEGPALINLNPLQAIEYFHHELERVD
jgi:hypothetical protein